MKKIVLTAAFLACAATIASAQVSSANIVGYAKVTATGGQLSLVALNFEGENTISSLIGEQLPGNSKVFLWDKSTGGYVTATKGRAGWSPDPAVSVGDAMWLQASGAEAHEIVLNGEVMLDATNTVEYAAGVEMTGYFYPVDTPWTATTLADDAPGSSKLHVWNGSGYTTYSKGRAGWSGNPTIGSAAGFWLETPEAFTNNEVRPFDLD